MSGYQSRNDRVLAELLTYVQEGPSEHLDIDKLPYLYRVLHQLSARWNSLSLQLSVNRQDEIQRNARTTDVCLAVCLVEWLQSGQATWKGLIEAVFRPAGGAHQVLARDIAKSYKSLCQFRPNSFAATVKPIALVASDESVRIIQQLLNNYVAARWYQMGVVLGVPPSDLEIIRESPEYHGAGEREAGMLKAWLERGLLPRTWQVLVDAVEDRAGGNHKVLAKKIATSPLDSYQVAPLVAPAVPGTGEDTPSSSSNKTAPIKTYDSNPSLRDLTLLKPSSGEKIEIIKSLAPDWKAFGVLLNFDDHGSQLSLIEAQHGHANPRECCRDMMIHWLLGNGEQPTSWRTLIRLLEDGERAYLAEQIKSVLPS